MELELWEDNEAERLEMLRMGEQGAMDIRSERAPLQEVIKDMIKVSGVDKVLRLESRLKIPRYLTWNIWSALKAPRATLGVARRKPEERERAEHQECALNPAP